MDIEGAELEALEGAKKTIATKKPKLQICIYHNPLHLFKIPLYIKFLNPGYKIFVGHHSGTLSELVMYAVDINNF